MIDFQYLLRPTTEAKLNSLRRALIRGGNQQLVQSLFDFHLSGINGPGEMRTRSGGWLVGGKRHKKRRVATLTHGNKTSRFVPTTRTSGTFLEYKMQYYGFFEMNKIAPAEWRARENLKAVLYTYCSTFATTTDVLTCN